MAYKWLEMLGHKKQKNNYSFDFPPYCGMNTILNHAISTKQLGSDIIKIKNVLFNTDMKGYDDYDK